MCEMLKNQIDKIIQKKSNFSRLKYKIEITVKKQANANQFPNMDFSFKKIDILCIETEFTTFTKINDEIKEIIKEIKKLNSAYLVSFIFENCYVKFWNENINLDWHIQFNKCNINVNVQDVHIDEIHLLAQNFHNCHFKNLSLLSGEVKVVQIDLYNASIDLFQISKIIILDSGTNKIEIKNSQIDKIMIQDAILKSEFTIYETKINAITIKNVDFESLSEFNEVTFQSEFDFQEITYKGLALFDRCIFDTKAQFEYVIFEKFTSFRGTTFNKGLNLDYTSGDKEINFSGIKGLEKTESKKQTSRETFRFIKNAFEKNGNKIEANLYHSYELKARKNELDNQSISEDNLLDKIVFFFNEKTSNHGLNWLLPIFWMIFIGLYYSSYFYSDSFNFFEVILFWAAITSSIYILFQEQTIKLKKYLLSLIPAFLFYSLIVCFNNNFGADTIFKFLNIISFEKDANISLMENTLSKAIMAYLIYQFVVSLRKDTRK